MRLFVALALPADVRDALHERLDVVRALRPELRWVRPENFHLTVRFLGECGPREADRQAEHWHRRAGQVQPFQARLRGFGAFPHGWMAKVLWCGVEHDGPGWAALAGPDQVPHITVARSRERVDLTGPLLELDDFASREWAVEQAVLYRSVLHRGRPPAYEAIDLFALGAASAR